MKTSIIILALLISLRVAGQDQLLKGQAIDEKGAPLSGVNIRLKGNSMAGTSSNNLGEFIIRCKPGDSIIFSYMGYETRLIEVLGEHFHMASHMFTVQLVHKYIPLKQVTITEKRDRSFRYLLDFEVIHGNILKLEIKGKNRFLILADTSGKQYWRCMLPDYMRVCNKLRRDFLSNIYLQSEDTLYQVNLDKKICQLLPGVYKAKYQSIMDPCIGRTSSGIVLRMLENDNQSVSIWIASSAGRTRIYEQTDRLAYKYLKDLAGKETFHAGLGFPVSYSDKSSTSNASLDRQHIQRGAPLEFASRIMSKPVSVESICINDSIFVFDNTINKIFIYNDKGELSGQCNIDFNNRDFLKKYIVDDQKKQVYGIYRNKKGIYLLPLNRTTGKVAGQAKWIDMYFPEKIRISELTAIYMKYDHVGNSRSILKTDL